MSTTARTMELKQKVLNTFAELLNQIVEYRAIVEELQWKNEEQSKWIGNLNFEKHCQADRIAELESLLHEQECNEIAKGM
jgi:hypothetical protein